MKNLTTAIMITALTCALAGFAPADDRPAEPRALSTTADGSFQAIAQSPDSITLYWKVDGPTPVIHVNGRVLADVVSAVDPVSGYTTAAVEGLEPGTQYAFSLGPDGPCVVEKTWSDIAEHAECDLLVLGGTASGVSAAVSAARLGMSVILVEDTNRLGGMGPNGLGASDIRNMARANGFFEDFRRLIIAHYGGGDGRKYEPRIANAIIKSMVYGHPRITVHLKSEAVEPIMVGNRVAGAVIRDLISGNTGRVDARVTIDATYNADFAAAAGCEYRTGREPRSECEPHAGHIYFDDKTQEILPGSTGKGDNKQQSYAYLMVWKDYDAAPEVKGRARLIEKPRFYDPEKYRYSPEWVKTWNYTSGRLPNYKYEINQHPFGTDWPCINHDYPTATKERRREIESMYRDRALGYLYYFQNELGHTNLGLADDEFVDNANFPVQLYIRESKRVMGEYLFRECDVTEARSIHRADSIAIGDYPMDSHAVEELTDPTVRHKGEGECWLVSFTPWYQAPYGVILPLGVDGLLVTTAVSATHIGYSSLRMEPVRMSMGQAAAASAYWSILYSTEPRHVRASWVQDKMLSQHAYINWNSDIDRDTRHFKAINFLGARGVFVNEEFEPASPLTREQALIVLNRMLGLENYPRGLEKSPLPDPSSPVTRGQFAVWLVEAKQKTSDEWDPTPPAVASYDDVPPDSPYYAAVETLRTRRITSSLFEGYEFGLFKPDSPISRGDAAQAIYLAHRAFAMNYWML